MMSPRPRKTTAIALLVVAGLLSAPLEGMGSATLPMLVPGDLEPGELMSGPEIPPHPAPSMSLRVLLSSVLLGKGVYVVPSTLGKAVAREPRIQPKPNALGEEPTP